MSYFKAEMHQILRLGVRPRPRWGSLQHFPDTLAGFKGILLRGKKRERREGREGGKKGRDRVGEGREG